MDTILAARYARALLSIGEEDGKYREYGEELRSFAGAFQAALPLAEVLGSPAYPGELRTRMLEGILAKAGLSATVGNFVRLLFVRGRIGILPAAAESYGRLTDEKDGILRGVVSTPQAIEDSQVAALREALKLYLGASRIELTQSLDTSLIAGIAVKVGDLVIDGSVRTQLMKFAAAFSAE
jgi:F-type H+-transporting ATPase subunit delta